MKVNFKTDYRDFAEAVWLASWAKAEYRNSLLNFILLYGMVAAVSSVVVLMYAPHYIFAAFNFVIVFLLCLYLFRPPNRAYFFNFYNAVYGSQPFNYEIEIDEEVVKISDELSKSFISWQRVKEITETEDSIFLIFKHQSAIKIPKTAFYEPQRAGEFIAFATSRIPNAEEALNVGNNQ